VDRRGRLVHVHADLAEDPDHLFEALEIDDGRGVGVIPVRFLTVSASSSKPRDSAAFPVSPRLPNANAALILFAPPGYEILPLSYAGMRT
jgi:hypothetical protein